MTAKRFQKRYIEKNNKVYDTWKEMPITDELNSDSLLNVLSHLNGLGEMIDTKIEQGRYCIIKYNDLQKENEQLKSEIKDLNDILARYEEKYQEECIYEYMKMIGEDTLNEMNKSKKNKEL